MSEPGATVVIFRKFADGDVIALFPYLPASPDPAMCESFIHFGQHGAADLAGVMSRTRPAVPGEYAALRRELESAPYSYRLTVRLRTPKDAAGARAAALRSDDG